MDEQKSDQEEAKVNERWRGLPKLYLPKHLVPILGYTATSVLAHLQYCLSDDGNRFLEHPEGGRGIKQSVAEMAAQITCSDHTLRGKNGVIQRLLDLKLLHKRSPRHGNDRSTIWSLNYPHLNTLLDMAEQFWKSPSLDAWEAWKVEHPVIMKKFASLNWDEIEKKHPFNGYHRINWVSTTKCVLGASPNELRRDQESIQKKRTKVLNQPAAELDDFISSSFGDNETAKSRERQIPMKVKETLFGHKSKDRTAAKECEPDKFVEHWNVQPHVPKCSPGTKGYEFCREFFAAHQRFAIGTGVWFLGDKYKKSIALGKINKEKLHSRGNRPVQRTDKEIFKHIEDAALAFHPEYSPHPQAKKKLLGKSLRDFLYNSHSFASGQSSRFLQYVNMPSTRLDDEDTLLNSMEDKADEHEIYIINVIRKLYNQANQRPESTQFDLGEFKTAMRIARRISELYCEIPIDRVPILGHHFFSYRHFITWWERYCEDHTWEGMPLNALHPDKNMWRRFIDYISADIGVHVLTGERV